MRKPSQKKRFIVANYCAVVHNFHVRFFKPKDLSAELETHCIKFLFSRQRRPSFSEKKSGYPLFGSSTWAAMLTLPHKAELRL